MSEGPVKHDGCYGLTLALRALEQAEDRKPAEADRPPLELFPMTAGARAALEYDRAGKVKVTALVLELRDALDAGADVEVIADLWIRLVERAEREDRRRLGRREGLRRVSS